jgi:hypothetical protein
MGSEVSWKDSGVMSKIPNNLKRIQVSRWFGIVDTPLSHASLHFDALRKELMNSIMPIGGPRSRPGFQVSLQPASPDLEELLAGALDHSSQGRDLTEALCSFIRFCAGSIIEDGKAIYELVSWRDSITAQPQKLDFFPIQPSTIFRKGSKFFQFSSEQAVRDRNRRNAVALPPDRLLAFFLPKAYRGFTHCQQQLVSIDNNSIFRLATAEQKRDRSNYSFSEHLHSQRLALASATRILGWEGLGFFDEAFLEFYFVKRYLLFRKFLIVLRQSILEVLNVSVKTLSTEFGPAAQLQIEGLPGLAEVETALKELEEGSRNFSTFIDQFS